MNKPLANKLKQIIPGRTYPSCVTIKEDGHTTTFDLRSYHVGMYVVASVDGDRVDQFTAANKTQTAKLLRHIKAAVKRGAVVDIGTIFYVRGPGDETDRVVYPERSARLKQEDAANWQEFVAEFGHYERRCLLLHDSARFTTLSCLRVTTESVWFATAPMLTSLCEPEHLVFVQFAAFDGSSRYRLRRVCGGRYKVFYCLSDNLAAELRF